MQLEALEYFYEIAGGKTFLTVAEDNYISQSSLSKTIRKLEEELGLKLLAKSGRSVKLTPAGFQIYHDMKEAKPYLDEMKFHIQQLKSENAIALWMSISNIAPIQDVFENFREEYPDILLCIDRNDYMRHRLHPKNGISISKEECDMEILHAPMFRNKEEKEKDIWAEDILFEDRVVALLSKNHPLCARKEVRLIDLNRYPVHLNAWMRYFYQKELVEQGMLLDQVTDKNYTREELVWHIMGKSELGLFYLSDIYMLNVQGITIRPIEDLPWQPVILRSRKKSLGNRQLQIFRNYLIHELKNRYQIDPRERFPLSK